MISKKEDFIVKYKDTNIEIKQSIFNNHKSVKTFIYVEIVAFAFILIKILFSKKIETGIVMYFGLFLIFTVVIIIEYNWSIRIRDKSGTVKRRNNYENTEYEESEKYV